MPPEVPHCRPPVTPMVQFSPQQNLPIDYKYFKGRKKMSIPIKKLLPALVLILSSFSVIRFLLIIITTSSSSTRLPTFSTIFQRIPSHEPGSSTKQPKPITEKEFHLLSNLVAHKSPCNLLIFGLEPKYLYLSQINAGGTTVFLEDDIGKLGTIKANSNSTKTFKVEYQTPQEVYEQKWDVIVVDGPRGDTPEAPGRMATIYSASIIARAGNTTDVAIHDVHRMIEKWFSWEFLCDENLVSSKGNLWIFRIRGQFNSTTFCSARPVVIE